MIAKQLRNMVRAHKGDLFADFIVANDCMLLKTTKAAVLEMIQGMGPNAETGIDIVTTDDGTTFITSAK
jgi:hypothetical protein